MPDWPLPPEPKHELGPIGRFLDKLFDVLGQIIILLFVLWMITVFLRGLP